MSDKLQFLQSMMKTTKIRVTFSIGNDSFQINVSFSSDEESDDIGKKSTPEAKPPKERKKNIEDAKTELLTSCINVLKEPSAASAAEPKEEIDHFAFHIARKLKTMSRHTRILAEKRINDAIFEIEMGEFQQHAEGRSTNYNVSGNPSSFQGPFMSALTNNNVKLL